MKYSVSRAAKLSGVSVRTLHYYDEIGLLKPSEMSDTGYRYYDEQSLEVLQQILFYRELDFSLSSIKDILSRPGYDKTKALAEQKYLLTLKKNRLEGLIELLDQTMKGASSMSFKEFDMTEIEEAKEKYKDEAEQRWGNTDAYRQSMQRTNSYKKEDWAKISAESGAIYEGFVENMNKEPSHEDVQALVERWKNHISTYFYDCNNEILAGLGEMYVADERFTKNIDRYGQGLAQFISDAIKIYCS